MGFQIRQEEQEHKEWLFWFCYWIVAHVEHVNKISKKLRVLAIKFHYKEIGNIYEALNNGGEVPGCQEDNGRVGMYQVSITSFLNIT